MQKPKVTIVLLTKNNADVLEELLSAIFSQDVNFSFEVLAIDSGSLDGSLSILKRCKYRLVKKKNSSRFARTINLRIHQIAPIEFGFGKIRNRAAELARGEITAFISTRTIPMDRDWLSNLISSLSPFTNVRSGVVASFGKVIPGLKITFSEAFRLKTFYGRATRIMSKDSFINPFSLLFSDLNCAILTCVLRKFPFLENITGGEDQVWAKTILENGMSIAYNPHAGVVFRRGHDFGEIFRHYFTKGHTLGRNVPISATKAFVDWIRFLIYEIIYLLKRGSTRQLVKEIFVEFGRIVGFFLGQRADRLPEGIRKRFLFGKMKNIL